MERESGAREAVKSIRQAKKIGAAHLRLGRCDPGQAEMTGKEGTMEERKRADSAREEKTLEQLLRSWSVDGALEEEFP